MRRYDDPVEVRRGSVPGPGPEGPEQFLWRGRLWKVRAVVAHWVETAPWWQSVGAGAVLGETVPTPEASRTTSWWSGRSGGWRQAEALRRVRPVPASSTSPSTGAAVGGSSSGAWTDERPDRGDQPLPAARDHPLLPGACRGVPAGGDDLPGRPGTLRLCPRRGAAVRCCPAGGPGAPGSRRAATAEERLGAAGRGGAGADRVGDLLRGGCGQAGCGPGGLRPGR